MPGSNQNSGDFILQGKRLPFLCQKKGDAPISKTFGTSSVYSDLEVNFRVTLGDNNFKKTQ
jgi:hypothetical protein